MKTRKFGGIPYIALGMLPTLGVQISTLNGTYTHPLDCENLFDPTAIITNPECCIQIAKMLYKNYVEHSRKF